MTAILAVIAAEAHRHPDRPAIADAEVSLSYADLQAEIARLAGLLSAERVALLLPNGCPWALIDLATQRIGATSIPLPTFFSDEQLRHVLSDVRPDLVVTDDPRRARALLGPRPGLPVRAASRVLTAFRLSQSLAGGLPDGTAKVTYTSGTTGRPKGVCLGQRAIDAVTQSLAAATGSGPADRTLSLLPLSTLLENIGGLYVPLLSGGQARVPDLGTCGIQGSSRLDPARLTGALTRGEPTGTILVPQLLQALVAAIEGGAAPPRSLRFLAVGGAHTASTLIERARRLGLPVHEGYGLSEACSVVSLNLPGQDRVGSVGRPLPHGRVRIAPDGEVLVRGPLMLGYLGETAPPPEEWRTGDLGYLDGDGYLHITGRKRSVFTTAYGRNVSPEWVEGELAAVAPLLQAAVFGEARPFNVAVLSARRGASSASIAAAVEQANRRLPDYAQVRRWVLADGSFSVLNGLANTTGAVDRGAVRAAYARRIEALYQEAECDVVL